MNQSERLSELLFKDIRKTLLDNSFDEQKKFIQSEAKFKLARCTRRAGKSHGTALLLMISCFKRANVDSFYFAITRRQAKLILWEKLKQISKRFSLGFKFNESDLVAVAPNKSRINFYGADQENLQDRILGIPFQQSVIDEAARFTNLERFIEEILEPGTIDFGGSIAMIGTPNPQMSGYFYEQDVHKNEYEKFNWSLVNNVFLPNAKQYLEDIKKRKNWTDDTPIFRREYLGQWVSDPDHMIYKLNSHNIVHDIKEIIDTYIIGFDIGWQDPCAFCVVGYNDYSGKLYVIHTEKHQHLTVSAMGQKLNELQSRFNAIKIVADSGALGKTIVEELKRRFSLNIIAAEKTDKYSAFEAVNSDLLTGDILILDTNTQLIEQMRMLSFNEDKMEDPTIPNDLCDSFLYSHRFSRHYWKREKLKFRSIEEKMQEQIDRECEEYQNKNRSNILF